MAPWLNMLTSLPEDLGSLPSTHMVAHNPLSLLFQPMWAPEHGGSTYIYSGTAPRHTHTQYNNNKNFKRSETSALVAPSTPAISLPLFVWTTWGPRVPGGFDGLFLPSISDG